MYTPGVLLVPQPIPQATNPAMYHRPPVWQTNGDPENVVVIISRYNWSDF